ncbi:MAG: energy transducer TonB [Terracidiphilus sp.]
MRHRIRCFSAALVFIAPISTSANGHNQRQFHSDEFKVYEAAFGPMDNFPGDPPLANTPAKVLPSNSRTVIIPDDVAAGMMIHKVNPEYPKKARKARISGIVILKATISKAGEISDLHAECGPEILLEPSLKAIRKWKYRPYLLRGEPVEVQTTIKVTFALGDKNKLPFSTGSCPVE